MNKAQRVKAVMKQEETDFVPAGFWFHYKPDFSVEEMIQEHLKLYEETDMEQTSTATSAKIKTYYLVKYKEGASGTIGGTMTKKPSIWVSCSYLGKVSTGSSG